MKSSDAFSTVTRQDGDRKQWGDEQNNNNDTKKKTDNEGSDSETGRVNTCLCQKRDKLDRKWTTEST